jgi:hypothetical protein
MSVRAKSSGLTAPRLASNACLRLSTCSGVALASGAARDRALEKLAGILELTRSVLGGEEVFRNACLLRAPREPTAPLYERWRNMKRRCHDPKQPKYPQYGGRGITVCDEWKGNYEAFRQWALSAGYKRSLILDREDNNGRYSPENCRWVTPRASANNRSNKRPPVTAFGETKTVMEWLADPRCGVSSYTTLCHRLKKMSPEEAITKPSQCPAVKVLD